MGESVLRVVSPFQRPCELCHRATKNLYRIVLDQYAVLVCSENCAIQARDRWVEKKKLGVVPYEKTMKEEPMMDDGGLGTDEEGGDNL